MVRRVQASLTIPPTLCFINNRNVLLIVLEAGKSKVSTQADLVSHENRLPESRVSSQCGRSMRAL